MLIKQETQYICIAGNIFPILGEKYYIPPITEAKRDIGDIILLTEFNFNEKELYQEATTIFPDREGNEILGRWYGYAITHGDKM